MATDAETEGLLGAGLTGQGSSEFLVVFLTEGVSTKCHEKELWRVSVFAVQVIGRLDIRCDRFRPSTSKSVRWSATPRL